MQTFELMPIGGKTLYWTIGIFGTIALLASLAVFGATLLMRQPKIIIGADGLHIDSMVFGRTIPLSNIDIAGAKRVDLAVSSDLQPTLRTMGVGLPGLKTGWFRLRDGSKALLFVTSDQDAVYVPTTDDYALIVTPADPDAFLAALKSAGR